MAIIVQAAPSEDTVVAGISADYSNKLKVAGAIGPVIFNTTLPTPGFIVLPDGEIETTGLLLASEYIASGTVSDGNGNSGNWTFALTVVGNVSPETGVTAVLPALPNSLEIFVPFQIDPATGGVAVLTNYVAILEQHIATIIMTALGERVMLPTYGIGLEQQTFKPTQDIVVSPLASDITKRIQFWEPAVQVNQVTIGQGQMPNQVVISVDFTVVPFGAVSTVTVSSGGPISQVVAL